MAPLRRKRDNGACYLCEEIAVDELSKALDGISYEWLMAQHPGLVAAIEAELGRGVTPARIKQRVLLHTQRLELALRCEQAARHMMSDDSITDLTGVDAQPAGIGSRTAG
jgi:hypothetical protein